MLLSCYYHVIIMLLLCYIYTLINHDNSWFQTGRYPLSLGMQYGVIASTSTATLPETEKTLPSVLHDNGYINYIVGKWHLGSSSLCDLPTSRGFDYFWGYVSAEIDYWSKRHPVHKMYKDISYSNKKCSYAYDGPNSTEYSTFFYRDKSVAIIQEHDFVAAPMFLYLPFQVDIRCVMNVSYAVILSLL